MLDLQNSINNEAPVPHRGFTKDFNETLIRAAIIPKALRPHQSEAVDAVFKALDKGITRQLIEAATGTGKTFIAVHIAQHFERVLFLVNRQELLHQTIRAFQDAGYSSDDIGVIWKNRQEDNRRFVIGMVQTVHARINQFNPKEKSTHC